MFWTDWSLQPFIARIGMDGSNMKTIIDTGIFWPNGLTIDYNTNRLWWLDAHIDQLESVLFAFNQYSVIKCITMPFICFIEMV